MYGCMITISALLRCALSALLCICVAQASSPDPHHHHHEPVPLGSDGGGDDDDDFPTIDVGMDVDHIKADLGRLGLPTEKLENLTYEEMDFYFFTLHDFNNDTMLDGCEILKALTHTIDENVDMAKARTKGNEEKLKRHIDIIYKTMIQMVDQLIAMADKNVDGYLTYTEYMMIKRQMSGMNPDEEKSEEERSQVQGDIQLGIDQ